MKTYLKESFFCRVICTVLIVFVIFGQISYASDVKQQTQKAGVTEQAQEAQQREQNVSDLLYLGGVLELIRNQYKGDVSEEELIYGAVRGMLGSLDAYTTYYDNEETDTFIESINGTFGGIGVSMIISGDYITILEVYPDTPAEKAGLLQGDKIVEADGVNLVKADTDKATSVIRGEVGTKVSLGILREGSDIVKKIDVAREIIRINPVTYEIRGEIGYIKLDSFNENTDEFMTKALKEMDDNNITKLVFDLRDNPGGEVNQAVQVARKFVPKGLITRLDYHSLRYDDINYYSYLDNPKYKLAVLVNGMSASASEIVAGAIQDTGAGKLVGTKTYGKAKFQSLIPLLSLDAFTKYAQQGIYTVNANELQAFYGIILKEGEIAGYTKMSLGVYYTPNGRMIDGAGLTPDVLEEDPQPVNGVYIDAIRKLTGTVLMKLNSEGIDVYYAEMILKAMGYKIAVPDNLLDADSVAALKSYQKKSDLYADGILGDKTRASLNNDLLKLIYKYDNQYSAAVDLLNQ